MGFRHRLALFLVVTLAAVQALTAISAYAYLRGSLVDRAKRDLADETSIFTRQLEVLSERVSSDVEVLSLDYALRQAIAQQDYGTELSALRNHGRRVGATRMMLVGLDGTINADTGSARTGRRFPYADLLSGAAGGDERTALANLDGHVYWIVAVPVLAPVPIAFIAACVPVDNALIAKLHDLSSLHRSIALATLDAAGRWRLVARTHDGPKVMPLPSGRAAVAVSNLIEAEDGEYITVTTRLPTAAESAPVVAVLAYPLAEAFAAYRAIVGPVIVVLVLALLAAVGGTFFVVRRACRPLEDLAGTARRIAKGDYTLPPPHKESDEIGQLSQALTVMTQSIAEREAALTSAIGALETARSEAVAANEAKSQFLANMSHELRTPLNAIVGFGDMLRQQLLGPLGVPRYVEYASDIHASGQRLLDLVSKMLDLAAVEAGRIEVTRQNVEGAEMLAQAVAIARTQAEKAGVRLSFAPADAKWPLLGDAAKLRQVFADVVSNAIKFTPAGGEVRVSAAATDGAAVVTIRDNGIGMRAEDLAQVTRPFHRLRHALDGQHQGAGLGLPYAYAIVTLHGGKLAIDSAPGAGTTVTISLPLKPAAAELAA